jgi:hypothetical protein
MRERLVQLPLVETLQDPGYLGQQVRPSGRELAQPGHRGRMLGAGKLPPLRVMPCLTHELGDEDTVGLRAIIEHRFYGHTELSNTPPWGTVLTASADLTATGAKTGPGMQAQGKPRCRGITPGLPWAVAQAMPAR